MIRLTLQTLWVLARIGAQSVRLGIDRWSP